MNKSHLFAVAAALTLGSAMAPTTSFAQEGGSCDGLNAAINAALPDPLAVEAVFTNLLAENPENLPLIQGCTANASPAIQQAVNNAVTATSATGTTGGGNTGPAANLGNPGDSGAQLGSINEGNAPSPN